MEMTKKREKKPVLQNVKVFSKKPLFWTKTTGNVIKGAVYFEKRLYSAFRNICLQYCNFGGIYPIEM